MGLITKYEPVNEVDMMITSLEYLNVMSPKGMVSITSKKTKDQTEWTENMELKSVFTSAPRMSPKTKLNLLITCPNEENRNVDQFGQSICDQGRGKKDKEQ